MDLHVPISLLRMLEVSCDNDKVKNWNVFEDKDGSYVFKIRFIPNKIRHYDDYFP